MQDQQQHPVWGSYAQRLLDPGAGLWKYPSNGGHDDKAHPPIHPTKFSAGESNWTPDHHVNSLIHNLLPNLFLLFSISTSHISCVILCKFSHGI